MSSSEAVHEAMASPPPAVAVKKLKIKLGPTPDPPASSSFDSDEAGRDPGEGSSTSQCRCNVCRRPRHAQAKVSTSSQDHGVAASPESSVDKFLSHSHAVMESLREMKGKEQAIQEAERLQERARACNDELSSLDITFRNDSAALEKQIAETKRQIVELEAAHEDQKRQLKRVRENSMGRKMRIRKRLRSVQGDPQFLEADEIARQKEELAQMSDVSSSLKGALGMTRFEDSDACKTVQCPVCFEIPKEQVFSCQQCSNLICQDCLSSPRVTHCPSCRKDFATTPATRSVLAERIIASVKNMFKQ